MSYAQGKGDRGTIFVEEARILEVREYPNEQFIIRLQAPQCAARAQAGAFVHLRCDDALPMRRPLSIMLVDPQAGWIDVLFKIVGDGLAALSRRQCGEKISVMGPIGKPFTPNPERPNALLVGGGVGIPPMIYLAHTLSHDKKQPWQASVLMGSEVPFPFSCVPATLALNGIDASATHALSLTEDWGVPSRLASLAGLSGAYDGYVTQLADQYLQAQSPAELAKVEIFACGPTPMLRAIAAVAAKHNVACQVSLEEFMACAVGGCAGCTVAVTSESGTAMKRVCVDGPVFDARAVFADAYSN